MGKSFEGYRFRDVKILDLSKNFQISQHFRSGVKIHQIILKRSMVILADIFTVPLRCL